MALIGNLPVRGFEDGGVSTLITRGFLAPEPVIPVVTVTCPSTTTGTVGIAFSSTASASGGTAPYTFGISAGSLPTGLTMSTAGVISGTPTVAGPFAFTISAIDAVSTVGSNPCSITIAALNTTPETCISLTLPSTITVDLHGAIGTGLWYCYVPLPNEYYLGVQVQPNPPSAYDPHVVLYSDISLTSAPPGAAGATLPVQMPVNPGQTYFFQFNPTGTPPVGTLASFTVRAAPNGDTGVGAIFVNDDTPGYRMVVLRASDGEVIKAIPFPAGEFGDILPSGIMCVEAENDAADVESLNVYTPQFTLIAALFDDIRGPNATIIRTDLVDLFYIIPQFSGVNPTVVHTIDESGVIGGTTWSLANDNIGSATIAPAGGILYWADGQANMAIKRHDLGTDLPLSDLVAGVAGYKITEMLTLTDGNVLVAYRKSPTNLTLDFLRLYSPAGATLHDYLLSDYAETEFIHFGHSLQDPAFFLIWKTTRSIQSSSYLNVRVSDGVVVGPPNFQTDNFEFGVGPDGTTQYFGPSFSCPFFLLTQPSIVIPPPAVLAISKVQQGTFVRGQVHATYQVVVSNSGNATTDAVVVSETIPSGFSLVSMAGVGWTCAGNICSRNDVLDTGESFPPITVTVDVAIDATSPQVNLVTVTSGDLPPASATVSTPLVGSSNACIATLPLG